MSKRKKKKKPYEVVTLKDEPIDSFDDIVSALRYLRHRCNGGKVVNDGVLLATANPTARGSGRPYRIEDLSSPILTK